MKLILRLLIVFAALYSLYFIHSSIGWRICYSQLVYASDKDYYRYLFEYIYDNNHPELIIEVGQNLEFNNSITEVTDGYRSVFITGRVHKTFQSWTGPMELIADTIRGAEIITLIKDSNDRWTADAVYVFQPCGNLATSNMIRTNLK